MTGPVNAADHILDELAIDSPEIEIKWHDIDQWISIMKTLPNNKARGADGWSFEEFKCLPRAALKHLACLMERVQHDGQWPSAAMQVRVRTPIPSATHAPSLYLGALIAFLVVLFRLASSLLGPNGFPKVSRVALKGAVSMISP